LCADSIRFFGHRNNVPELVKALDVFVLSSVAEGMPRAVLEVMAAGVPCIATEVGGIPEIINSKDVGILVRPGDSSVLAEAMIEVANMPGKTLAELAENAKDRVHRFYSHDVVREKIKSLYNKVRYDVLKSSSVPRKGKPSFSKKGIDYERFANAPEARQETRTELNIPSDAFVCGTIARFGPYKGHNFLIKAFKKLKDRLPSAHLFLVGEGPLKEQLQCDTAASGLAQSVHFLGYRSDIPRLLGAIDCFVLPSIGSEGMPRVILEAMAVGVPCVATDVGGNSEIINSKDVGILVRPGDSSALAEAMMEVANMPEKQLVTLTENAKDRVRRFYSHDVVRKKLENLYNAEMKNILRDNR
jgi:glycosyltransferase involved in cell wall biosynthesis